MSTYSNTHTFAENPFAPITIDNEHYFLIYIGTGPTSNMSDYSTNASAKSPAGSHPVSPPSCYSPHTMENIFATNASIDSDTLCDITTSLAQTVKNCKEIHCLAIIVFEDKIKRLELTIEGYAETYEQAPDGYICNTMYLDLKIPVGEGAYTEAYWVTAAHNRYVQCYGLPFRD